MFVWDETIKKLKVPAAQVVKLMRSMRDVQMALPRLPSQEASAYLCQYQVADAITTVAVFHLQRSKLLAFYFSEPREVNPRKADMMFDQGLNFVESMGFLLTDMDIEQLSEADRTMLWESLPLQRGIDLAEKPAAPEIPSSLDSADSKPPTGTPLPAGGDKTVVKSGAEKQSDKSGKSDKPDRQGKPDELSQVSTPVGTGAENNNAAEAEDKVDELLAAVQSLRARRPGLPSRKRQPKPEEIIQRRLKFKENLGHILSSL